MGTRIKVLWCMETVGSGGVEQRRLTLARHLDPDVFDKQLICTQALGALPEKLEAAGCKIHTVGQFRGIRDRAPYQKAYAIARRYRPDIIHGAVYEGVALAAVVGRLARCPVIIGEETDRPVYRSWKGHALFRSLAAMTHHMVAVSGGVASYLVDTIRVPRTRVTTILNGVQRPPPVADESARALRRSYGWRDDHLVVGSVGRMRDRQKRFSDLIDAFGRFVEGAPEARLLLVGKGPDQAQLVQQVRDAGLADRVAFAGYQGDPSVHYAAMDIFALPSAHEAFGLVFVEAMYAGLATIGTHVGGIPDIIVPEQTGLLIDPFRPDQLASSLARLRDDPELRQRLGKAGRRRAEQNFSAERYARDVHGLYQTLLARHANIEVPAPPRVAVAP